jgi:GR25 family glycosyltransferase involved in LPS biosynthesis
MNPFNYFEKIFCINLNKRSDRWIKSQEEFKKIGIIDKVERFPAIEMTDGRIGCIKSHLEIIKYAKENDLQNVLVFEDDVLIINDDINNIMLNVISQLPEKWDMLYLGANLHRELENYSENLVILKNGYSTHAVCYNKNIYDKMIDKFNTLNNISTFNDILDVWISENIQENGLVYLIKPLIATQRNEYSDIEKNNIDYSFIKERYKKFVK